MKKLLFIFLILLPCFVHAQNFSTETRSDRIVAKDSLEVNGTTIGEISKDLTMSDSSNFSVPTEAAVKAYVDANSGGGGSNNLFNSNRDILRPFTSGVNVGGSTLQQLFEWMYFTAPTLTINQTPIQTVYEVGTSVVKTLSGITTNPGNATLSNGVVPIIFPVSIPMDTIHTFNDSSSYTHDFTFSPQQSTLGDYNSHQYTFKASQSWSGSGESGTANSNNITMYGVYPVLYGMSGTDLSSSGDLYSTLTKLVEREGNKTVTLNGTGYIYFAIPENPNWLDDTLSSILDHNGFNVLPSFTVYDRNVTSSGLVNNYVNVPYKLYKLDNLTTTNNYNYIFNQ